MSADLIRAGKMSLEDALSNLPFAQKGATPAMRNASKKSGFKAADTHLVKAEATNSQIEEHTLRQQELFIMHFRLKAEGHIDINDPKAVKAFQEGEYKESIQESIEKFYGV